MSAFCYDCIQRIFPDLPPEGNDLRQVQVVPVWDICEGCGSRC